MQIKKPEKTEVSRELIEYIGSKKLAVLAFKRGLDTKKKLKEFIEVESYTPLSVEEFPNINKIVNYILNFIKNDKNILIYGDYDVDGITATSILVAGLKKLSSNIKYHIPDRFKEGYGLNKEVIESYADEIDLIISCDCGITNHEEVNYAKELGINIIVTDHHDLPDQLPEADFVLSPRLLEKNHKAYWLPGAGMAYFLIKAVYKEINMNGQEEEFLDLLLLAIIADVVPLIGENRYLFKTALKKLKNTKRAGLKALYNVLDINPSEINEKVLGFQIGPVLNSAGRIDSAEKGLKLLIADNFKNALGIAAELIEINKRRKDLSQKIYLEAEKLVDKKQKRGLIIFNQEWHQGVVGIAAGRIVENYQIPAVFMTLNKENNLITGSARSIEGVNINKIIGECSDLLEKHGGHAAAAGFSLKKDRLEKFKVRLQRLIDNKIKKQNLKRVVEPELELKLAEIEDEFYKKLRMFAPFGEANPEPIFYTEAQVLSSRSISQGKHKRLVLSDGDKKFTALWWWADEVQTGIRQRTAFKLTENIYRGSRSLQLEIKALESSVKDLASSSENIKKAEKTVKVIDLRNINMEQLDIGREDTVYFLEGRKQLSLYPIINRDYQRKAERLVLIAFPPSAEILKEMIILTGAEEIALSSIVDNSLGFKEFISSLMGLIKYTINHKNGILNITDAAVFLSEKEITIKRGLDYLRAKAALDYEFISYAEVLISKDGNIDKGMIKLKARQLNHLLKESAAFRRYLQNSSIEKIENTINNLL
jgi:single-stranded-DNA-specific exonuclease